MAKWMVCATIVLIAAGCATAPGSPGDAPEGLDAAAWERELVAELNLLRADPQDYARRWVAPLARRYVGELLLYPGGRITMTREGVAAVNDCLAELASAPPAGPLVIDPALGEAAAAHIADTGLAGLLGHEGSDGSTPPVRVARVDPSLRGISEAIHYGPGDARRIVLSLLVDDGVPDRSHRRGILSPRPRLVGAARGAHRDYGVMAVIDFAAGRDR